jgi:hypothetical protein
MTTLDDLGLFADGDLASGDGILTAQERANPFNQQTLDAQRANELQKVYAPYQQAGFLSDIYKGAPSSQMSTQVASQPSASPFQQAVGIGLGAISTAAGAKKAGLGLF